MRVGGRSAGDRQRAGAGRLRRSGGEAALRLPRRVRAGPGHVLPGAARSDDGAGAAPGPVAGQRQPVAACPAQPALRPAGDLLPRRDRAAHRRRRGVRADRGAGRGVVDGPGTGLPRLHAARPDDGRGPDTPGAAARPGGGADRGGARDGRDRTGAAHAHLGAAVRRGRGRVHAGRRRGDGARRRGMAHARARARRAGQRRLPVPRAARRTWSTSPGPRWPPPPSSRW